MIETRIILVKSRDPVNIGASARAAMNFGITDFAVVQPYEPSWRRTTAAASGTPLLKKARQFKTLRQALADRELVIGTAVGTGRKLQLPAVYLDKLGARLKKRFPGGRGRVAILFGSEKSGLSNEETDLCHEILTIPTSPECPSMNLGQSVALVCYELARAQRRTRAALGAEDPERMSAEQTERVAALAEQVMKTVGYMPDWTDGFRRATIRRTLLRWDLRSVDEYLVSGGLRWVLKKLK